jgi:hypothetical protein
MFSTMARLLFVAKQQVGAQEPNSESSMPPGASESSAQGKMMHGKSKAASSAPHHAPLSLPAWRPSGKVRSESESSVATASTVVDNPVFVGDVHERLNVSKTEITMYPSALRVAS